MTLQLKVFQGDALVSTHPLDKSIFKIGQLPSAQIRLEGAGVARIHAVLQTTPGPLCVIDLGTEQGTFLDGKRVNKADLKPGDEISIGEFRLRVEEAGALAELEGIGARLSAVREEARALVEAGRDAEAVALVCRRAGLQPAEAKEYVEGLHRDPEVPW